MGRVVLDSSVLISMYYEGDIHSAVVKNFMEGKENAYFISAISLAETLTRAASKGSPALDHMSERIRGASIGVVDVNQEVALAASMVRAKKGIRIPDAIISATATMIDAELWTLDKKLAAAHKGAILIA